MIFKNPPSGYVKQLQKEILNLKAMNLIWKKHKLLKNYKPPKKSVDTLETKSVDNNNLSWVEKKNRY